MGMNYVTADQRVIFSLARYCQIVFQAHLHIYTPTTHIRFSVVLTSSPVPGRVQLDHFKIASFLFL